MISNIGLVGAFVAGIISFLSPCVLPLVPGYVSYISGNSLAQGGTGTRSPRSTLLLSSCFVLGFSTIFVLFGASATALGRLLLSFRYEATIAGGLIVVLFGVFMTGLVRIPWLEQDLRFHGDVRAGRPAGAYLLGTAFGFGWTPCIGPVLGAILTASALSASVTSGILLLAIYSLGLGVPFIVSAAFADGLMRRLRTMRRAGRYLQVGAGVVMILMGVAMITGRLSLFSYWLLENFPLLARIG
ncbi:cytochrome c biogenesis CcdA family protein [Geminicoccus roseus]|uniref:cytochrome c biogenesis CcdA family protein n=1 Tax=Geminicoccus roseus TaxID=404900 RepID=UPI000429F487|nr:cytochrome c biogenesis protein CcdA [Geminicoccus roseus]